KKKSRPPPHKPDQERIKLVKGDGRIWIPYDLVEEETKGLLGLECLF
ncbi:hypothetical protein AVEN_194186-1, partial [Araneus ventricosus]